GTPEPRRQVAVEAVVAETPRDTDHRQPGFVLAGVEPDPLADGLLPRPVALGEGLVHDNHGGSTGLVARVEGAARHDRDPERLEEARTGNAVAGARLIARTGIVA